MLLSNIIIKHQLDGIELIRDVEFKTLSLAGDELGLSALTFVEDKKYLESLTKSQKMIITNKEIVPHIDEQLGLCITDDPRILFFTIHNLLSNDKEYVREIYKTKIGNNCKISDLSCISKNNVTIGNNITIEEFVSIKENVTIGDNSIIRAGTIIGGEGFEFKRSGEGIIAIKHTGGVIIEKNVELQQNNCVDKAIYPWDNTIIENGCKTDNFVHIAHACKLDERVFIAAQTCIAGRVIIGKDVWIGPGVTIVNGISIKEKAKISIGSVVTKSIDESITVTGNFAIEHSKFIDNLKKTR